MYPDRKAFKSEGVICQGILILGFGSWLIVHRIIITKAMNYDLLTMN